MSHYIPTMVPQWLVSSPVKIATLLEIADVGLSANRVHLNINQINSSSMSISFETWPEMVGIPHVHQLILNVGCIYPSYKPILSALIIKPLEQWSNPLSFHYKNGRTIMDYDSAQYYKGSIIPELMFKQHWFWTLILLVYMQCMMMCIYICISYRPLNILIVLSPCSLLRTKTHVDSSPAVFWARLSDAACPCPSVARYGRSHDPPMRPRCVGQRAKLHIRKGLPKGVSWL